MIEVWAWLPAGCESLRELVDNGPQNMQLRGVHPQYPHRPPDPITSNLYPGSARGRWIKVAMRPSNVFDALNCIDTEEA